MKKLIAYLCMMIFVLTSAAQSQTDESKMNRFVSGLMKKMTLEEKVGQLSQCSGGFATGPDNTRISRTEDISKGLIGSLLNVSGAANTRKYQEAAMKSRLRIPLIFGLDVIHGFRTGFPLPLAEAASFDFGCHRKRFEVCGEGSVGSRIALDVCSDGGYQLGCPLGTCYGRGRRRPLLWLTGGYGTCTRFAGR